MRLFRLLTFAFGITIVCVDAGKSRSDAEKPRGDSGSEKDNCFNDCPSEVSEVGRVCASDGDTYDSQCHFDCENKSANLRIISYEACKHKNGNYKRSKLEKAKSKKSGSKKDESKKDESKKDELKKGESKKDESKKDGKSKKSDEDKEKTVHSSSESAEANAKVLGINLGNLRGSGVSKALQRR